MATTAVQETNGASTGSATTVNSIRFKHADTFDASAVTTPMVKPGSGLFDRSYIKHLSLYCSVAPSTNFTNGQFYLSTPPTGVNYYCMSDSAAYSQATADATLANDTTYNAGTSASRVNPTSGANAITFLSTTFTGTGRVGQYVRVYMRLADTVTAGTLAGTTFTFSYDEI
jgi:hypothetical protein